MAKEHIEIVPILSWLGEPHGGKVTNALSISPARTIRDQWWLQCQVIHGRMDVTPLVRYHRRTPEQQCWSGGGFRGEYVFLGDFYTKSFSNKIKFIVVCTEEKMTS